MSKSIELNVARVVVTSGMTRSLMQSHRLPEKSKFEMKQVGDKLTFSLVAPIWLKGAKLEKYLKKKTEVLNRAIIRLGIWLAKAFLELGKSSPAYNISFHYEPIVFVEGGLIRKQILTLSVP